MRTLVNGADTLNYNLYTANTYTTVWGDNTGGTGHATGTGAGMGVPQTQSLTVYGRLRAVDNVAGVGAGIYSDTITATITY
jgi:spore coat protein U-like protein